MIFLDFTLSAVDNEREYSKIVDADVICRGSTFFISFFVSFFCFFCLCQEFFFEKQKIEKNENNVKTEKSKQKLNTVLINWYWGMITLYFPAVFMCFFSHVCFVLLFLIFFCFFVLFRFVF